MLANSQTDCYAAKVANRDGRVLRLLVSVHQAQTRAIFLSAAPSIRSIASTISTRTSNSLSRDSARRRGSMAVVLLTSPSERGGSPSHPASRTSLVSAGQTENRVYLNTGFPGWQLAEGVGSEAKRFQVSKLREGSAGEAFPGGVRNHFIIRCALNALKTEQ